MLCQKMSVVLINFGLWRFENFGGQWRWDASASSAARLRNQARDHANNPLYGVTQLLEQTRQHVSALEIVG
jgi:hypothetical protein